MALRVISDSFSQGAPIPMHHSGDGEDVSPHLQWGQIPENTGSFVLIMDDPDAPSGTFTHWVLFDIPASVHALAEGESGVGVAGKNDFQGTGYGGPAPPPRHGRHRYYFKIFALDIESLELSAGVGRQAVEQAMEGHVLDQGELMGTFERR